jgi:hypothetical protein
MTVSWGVMAKRFTAIRCVDDKRCGEQSHKHNQEDGITGKESRKGSGWRMHDGVKQHLAVVETVGRRAIDRVINCRILPISAAAESLGSHEDELGKQG